MIAIVVRFSPLGVCWIVRRQGIDYRFPSFIDAVSFARTFPEPAPALDPSAAPDPSPSAYPNAA
jgi:hypothetical protein